MLQNEKFCGKYWTAFFMKRRKTTLSQRTSKNISYGRANLDQEVIYIYFMNLEKELEGIPIEKQWNYDEKS